MIMETSTREISITLKNMEKENLHFQKRANTILESSKMEESLDMEHSLKMAGSKQ